MDYKQQKINELIINLITKHRVITSKIWGTVENQKMIIDIISGAQKNGARQNHGFLYEDHIIKKYNMIKEIDYIGCYDAYKQIGDKKIPIQIKYIAKKSSIDMGDYLRNKNKISEFILIVGFYTNKYDYTNVDEYILYIDNITKWKELFEFSYDKELKVGMNLISNLRIDDENWKNYCEKYKSYWNKSKRYIQLRFKRDHKCQKRIQCAINNTDFECYFLKTFERLSVI